MAKRSGKLQQAHPYEAECTVDIVTIKSHHSIYCNVRVLLECVGLAYIKTAKPMPP